MIRTSNMLSSNIPAGVTKGDQTRVGTRSTLTADIGLSIAAIFRDPKNKQGGFVILSGSVKDFTAKAEKEITTIISRLKAMGSEATDIECAIIGGTNTAKWQADKLKTAIKSTSLTPHLISSEMFGNFYRIISFDISNGVVSINKKEENPAHWSPAASALGINDGVRVFSQNAASGKVANATRFFREKKSFKGIRELIFPEFLLGAPKRGFRMWCAASSSGEEPYSYAMYLLRLIEKSNENIPLKIYGTDINKDMLEKAKEGEYEVPRKDMNEYRAYFNKFATIDGLKIKFNDNIKRFINFRPFDIRKIPRKHKFKFIVCANVFQYYNNDARLHFMKNFMEALERPGYIYANNIRKELIESLGATYYPQYGLTRVD